MKSNNFDMDIEAGKYGFGDSNEEVVISFYLSMADAGYLRIVMSAQGWRVFV